MIQKRIQEAKVLLSTTNLQISEISIIIGFTSQSYFAQAFKKATGISPIQFRKNHSEQ
ncbi:MAG: helix-turn-helix domain-containing protein [Holdemanella porci]